MNLSCSLSVWRLRDWALARTAGHDLHWYSLLWCFFPFLGGVGWADGVGSRVGAVVVAQEVEAVISESSDLAKVVLESALRRSSSNFLICSLSLLASACSIDWVVPLFSFLAVFLVLAILKACVLYRIESRK